LHWHAERGGLLQAGRAAPIGTDGVEIDKPTLEIAHAVASAEISRSEATGVHLRLTIFGTPDFGRVCLRGVCSKLTRSFGHDSNAKDGGLVSAHPALVELIRSGVYRDRGAFVFIYGVGLCSGHAGNPNMGILVLPAVLLLGLALIPFGVYLSKQGTRKDMPQRVFNRKAALRRLITFLGITTLFNVLLGTQLSYRAVP
jgi:hypothetical protein